MATTGIKARFRLGTVSNPSTLVDLTALLALVSIEAQDETDEVDATPIQPDAIQPTRQRFSSFQTSGVVLTFNWSPSVQAAANAVRGGQGLSFEYGPQGNAPGQTVLVGEGNVTHAGRVPGATPASVSQIQVRVRFTSVADGVVPGALVMGELQVDGQTDTTVDLSWTAATGGAVPFSYVVQRADDVSGSPGTWAPVSAPMAGLSFQDGGGSGGGGGFGFSFGLFGSGSGGSPDPGTTYHYRVIVTDDASQTDTSNVVMVTTDP